MGVVSVRGDDLDSSHGLSGSPGGIQTQKVAWYEPVMVLYTKTPTRTGRPPGHVFMISAVLGRRNNGRNLLSRAKTGVGSTELLY